MDKEIDRYTFTLDEMFQPCGQRLRQAQMQEDICQGGRQELRIWGLSPKPYTLNPKKYKIPSPNLRGPKKSTNPKPG